MRPYPIIEYSHKIGKNTAEFTLKDFAQYMTWWLKEKPRKDIMEATEAQRNTYKKDVEAMKQWREDEAMAKKEDKRKEEEKEEEKEEVGSGSEGEEVVCSMELTRTDIKALIFSIERTFADYEMEEDYVYTISLKGTLEGLQGT